MNDTLFATIEVRSMTIYGLGGSRHDCDADARENGADLSNVYYHPSEGDLANLRTHGGFATLPTTPEMFDTVEEQGGAYEDVPIRVGGGRIELDA